MELAENHHSNEFMGKIRFLYSYMTLGWNKHFDLLDEMHVNYSKSIFQIK